MVEAEHHPGRPAQRWIYDILKWCGKDLRDAATMTEDKIEWRGFVTSPYSPSMHHADHVIRRRTGRRKPFASATCKV